ncbi:hypothetical protein LBMAG15_15340 [Actinomycetes bacterium]|nr:hypothetical protein LBMAG15_15340 [Actinomycetes bacterium]
MTTASALGVAKAEDRLGAGTASGSDEQPASSKAPTSATDMITRVCAWRLTPILTPFANATVYLPPPECTLREIDPIRGSKSTKYERRPGSAVGAPANGAGPAP